MMQVDFISHLLLQGVQRVSTGINLLQHVLVLHSRERPQGGVHRTHTRAILLQSRHTLSLAISLQSHMHQNTDVVYRRFTRIVKSKKESYIFQFNPQFLTVGYQLCITH